MTLIFEPICPNNGLLLCLYKGDYDEILTDLALRKYEKFKPNLINEPKFINEYVTRKGIGAGYFYLQLKTLTKNCLEELIFGCRTSPGILIYGYFGTYGFLF